MRGGRVRLEIVATVEGGYSKREGAAPLPVAVRVAPQIAGCGQTYGPDQQQPYEHSPQAGQYPKLIGGGEIRRDGDHRATSLRLVAG